MALAPDVEILLLEKRFTKVGQAEAGDLDPLVRERRLQGKQSRGALS